MVNFKPDMLPAIGDLKIQFHSCSGQPTLDRYGTRAVFLDRDGTIIVEKNYLHRPEDVEIFPGAGPALKSLPSLGSSSSLYQLSPASSAAITPWPTPSG